MAYNRANKNKRTFHNKSFNNKPFEKKEYVKPKGLQVIVKNGDIQKALRKLKRIIKDDGLL